VLVPHSRLIGSWRDAAGKRRAIWDGDASTFDLWAGLIGGATVAVTAALPAA
jgi:hypothetical protein